ncbi:MAG: COX15/CtaA family protein [Candidatus Margulisiibacteriota bacterium]
MQRQIKLWLLAMLGLIASIVVIGGITRLTGSGLSMVNWQPIMGSIPPLSATDWANTFDAYKQSPEFIKLNHAMNLNEFKFIFFWEYIHRMLGRLIGLSALAPFIFFMFKKQLSPSFIRRWLGIILLIGGQGLMGWYMVKSGLIDNPHVSHFRLAAHLSLAFLIFSLILKEYLLIQFPARQKSKPNYSKWLNLGLILISIQIIYGAFTAGLHAGYYYKTYPKMGDAWFPSAALMYDGVINNILNNPIMIQWIHRWLALAVVVVVLIIWNNCKKSTSLHIQYGGVLLIASVSFQFILGVITILSGVWLPVALAHQFGALILLTSFILLHYLSNHQLNV